MQHQCRQGEQRTSRTMFPGGSSMRPCTSLARRSSFTLMIQVPAKWAYFLPPTKLQEGNVFTHVCYSVHREIWCHFLSGPMFLPRRGYDVTSCLVPCSFQGVWSRGGGGYSLWGGGMVTEVQYTYPWYWHLVVATTHPTGMYSCFHFLLK